MSGLDYQRERMAQAEAARQQLIAAARSGEFYAVGERRRGSSWRGRQQRVMALKQEAIQEYANRERRQRAERAQREADEEAQQYSDRVFDAARQRLEGDPEIDPADVETAAAAWRRIAQEEHEREQGRRLSDAADWEMGPEEWVKVYDPDKGAFRPGYVYEPGDGAALARSTARLPA